MTEYSPSRLRELDEERCWQLLAGKTIGRLAVAVANRPDVFPVNYVVADQTILVRTSTGQKLAAAVLGTAVAFEVDAIDETSHAGWSIVVKGSASEVEKLSDYLDAADLDIDTWAGGYKARYMRITPTEVTGREIPDPDFLPGS